MKLSVRKVFRFAWVGAGLVFIGWNVMSFQAHNLNEATFTTTNTVEVNQTNNCIAFKTKSVVDKRFVLTKRDNHAQFGYYGSQSGDDQATISRTEQQRLVEHAIVEFLQKR